MTEYVINIPNWNIPSVNKIMGRNPHKANRIKTGATQMIGFYAKGIPQAAGKRLVVIEHTQPLGRLPDPENLFKICHDSLKNLRLIIDDASSKLDFVKPIVKYGKRHTKITISEVV